jgi:hypothetical protein
MRIKINFCDGAPESIPVTVIKEPNYDFVIACIVRRGTSPRKPGNDSFETAMKNTP